MAHARQESKGTMGIVTIDYKKLLGDGGYSIVWDGKYQFATGLPESPQNAAVKVFKNKVNQAEAREEVGYMLQLQGSPYVVKLFDFNLIEDPFWLAMEKMDASLFHILNKEPHRILNDLYVLQLTLEIVSCIRYMHEQHIVHRDIKPENILLTEDKPKLADFGFADKQGAEDIYCGSGVYIAPERLGNKKPPLSSQSDIYSLGIMMLDLVFGAGITLHPAFTKYRLRAREDQSPAKVLVNFKQIVNDQFPKRKSLDEYIALIYECTRSDPRKRPTAAQLEERLQKLIAKKLTSATRPSVQGIFAVAKTTPIPLPNIPGYISNMPEGTAPVPLPIVPALISDIPEAKDKVSVCRIHH